LFTALTELPIFAVSSANFLVPELIWSELTAFSLTDAADPSIPVLPWSLSMTELPLFSTVSCEKTG
jgi:hypothetical protein